MLKLIRWSLAFLLIPVLSAGLLELASRIVHLGKAPLLPYYFDHGAALLPPAVDLWASFYGRPANRYTTDAWGARIASPRLANDRLQRGVFVVGDSQALGYMSEFEETFASRVAEAILGEPNAARILAAPANHPETYISALDHYAPAGLEHQRLAVVTLNLGNDLDEMYSEGLAWSRERTHPLSAWLLTHSFAYMDCILIRSHRVRGDDDLIGVNKILYMLEPDERIILARQAVERLLELIARIPADRQVVLIVPSDLQVNPAELEKYRRYYRSAERFEELQQNAAAFAGMMNAVENYIARRLESGGREVVRFSKLASKRASLVLFDDSSHHLTPTAHEMITRAILETSEDGYQEKP